jgi:tRNA pseudouridine38-40 synthase
MKRIEQPTTGPVWKVVLAYDGTEFHGWQVQPNCVTVQGELRDALARITGEDVLPQGSGRTDAGVHALGQVASFALKRNPGSERFSCPPQRAGQNLRI